MSLKITRAGIFDTVQDTGRKGYQHLGINPGGAMDLFAAQMANALLGKELHAPVVELHFPASVFLFEQPVVLCITGADFAPVVDGNRIPLYQPVAVPAGALLEWQGLQQGRWCYVSVWPGLHAHQWLGSYSTHTKAKAGGWQGRNLQKADRIPMGKMLKPFLLVQEPGVVPLHWKANGLSPIPTVHFLKGAEWRWMSKQSQQELQKEPYLVTRQSDRMGYRLAGKPLQLQDDSSMLSSAVTSGTMQLLPDGQLIVLMADHQTTGGYPRIGYVISAHLPHLAQLQPGLPVHFEETTLEQAEQALFQQKVLLTDLQQASARHIQKL